MEKDMEQVMKKAEVLIEALPYILDIDLVAFHSQQAIEPVDPLTFYRLIRNAVAITIATEAECVEGLKFDDEPINANMLLDQVLGHIETAGRDSTRQQYG